MERTKIFDMEFLEIHEDLENIDEKSDVTLIFNPDKDTVKDYLKKGYFYKPYKITYQLKVPESEDDYLSSLKRNKRKRILKAKRDCEHISIEKQEKLKKESFDEWYDIYETNIESKEKGRVFADREWFDRNGHKMGGIFAFDKKIVGGILFTKKKDGLVSISFSSTKKEYLKLGLNDLLNEKMVMFASKLGFSTIERGMDKNLYGHHLSPGLFVFKTSLGFRPVPKKDNVLMKINDFSKFGDEIFFIDYDGDSLRGNLIVKDEVHTEINIGIFKTFRTIKRDSIY